MRTAFRRAYSAVLIIVVLTLYAACGEERVPRQVILEFNLERPIVEYSGDGTLQHFFEPETMSLTDIVGAIERAAADERVKGLIAYIGDNSNHPLAVQQEVRDAIQEFRNSNKFAIAFCESLGTTGAANGAYYLASGFDEIWLQPSGSVGLTGFVAYAQFFAGTLEKLGVKVEGGHRKQYKNAYNQFVNKEFTEAHREATKVLLEDLFDTLTSGIAEARGMEKDFLAGLIDRGPFLAEESTAEGLVSAFAYPQESVGKGLIDKLGYQDQAIDAAKERTTDARLLYLHKYLQRAGTTWDDGETIAVVYGIGAIVSGESDYDPVFGRQIMGSETVSNAIRDAAATPAVKAIVLRIDSPGGSAVASDTIWREVVRAQEQGKPVVVSMSSVAASGGYYVSAPAAKIVAHPTTITGSIGVLMAKLITRDLWSKVGITFDSVRTSANAAMWSELEGFSGYGKERLEAFLDDTYQEFKQKVADGREMSLDQVEDIAKGRVWSGSRAHKLGLVDELGGFSRALHVAAAEAGLDPSEPLRVQVFPRPKGFFEELFAEGPDSSRDRRAKAAVYEALEPVRPIMRNLADQSGWNPYGGILSMPHLYLEY